MAGGWPECHEMVIVAYTVVTDFELFRDTCRVHPAARSILFRIVPGSTGEKSRNASLFLLLKRNLTFATV